MLSKVFMDMDAYDYVKQRKSMQDGWVVFFDVHKVFFDHIHLVRQAVEAKRMPQNSHYNGEKKEWDWDKYVALHKE